MRIHDGEINRLALDVVRGLVKAGFIRPAADEKRMVERVARVILDDLRAEEALEQEAEQVAAKLGRQALGMDQRKLVEGIKARLAKERGFTL